MIDFREITQKAIPSVTELVSMLCAEGASRDTLFATAKNAKTIAIGNKVHFRGLIEFSNVCAKNCYYCGIRKGNQQILRYSATDEEITDACRFALDQGFGSVVLQSGELSSKEFIIRVDRLVRQIKQLSSGTLGITLSCGEQSGKTYKRWFESGAHRYLLRIETSNPALYKLMHPDTRRHSFEKRITALYLLKENGYQLGTGVMIGLPFQTMEDLANDLLFFQQADIDMCGMGPYIEHENTPLYQFRNQLMPIEARFFLALNMVATLRILMPDINIAASTALQAIDPEGREKALAAGANIIMPNITPQKYRSAYLLYEGKPCTNEDAEITSRSLVQKIEKAGFEIGFGEWGDSKHYKHKAQ
jgi:biotin synthase